MTYQLQTVVAEATTAHGSLSSYFSFAVVVMTMAVAMVSLAEMMDADSAETIAHVSSLSYFSSAAVAVETTTAVDADANSSF